MAAFDYAEMAELVTELVLETGRSITLYKLSATPADSDKPWRGTGSGGPTRTDSVTTTGVFVIPNTSIPTESRGLAFDWVDKDLLAQVRHVCLVPAQGLANLENHKLIVDDSEQWKILWGQCFKPGPVRLFYVFGVAQ